MRVISRPLVKDVADQRKPGMCPRNTLKIRKHKTGSNLFRVFSVFRGPLFIDSYFASAVCLTSER